MDPSRHLRQGLGLSFVLAVIFFLFAGCAYHWGNANRGIPGGYKSVHIPMFKNRSMEPAIEAGFTSSLIQEFERAQVAKVKSASDAEVMVEGEILAVTYAASNESSPGANFATATLYSIQVDVKARIRKISDGKILWESNFSRVRPYSAPALKQAVVNSANPLYNLSARRQNIEVIAKAMTAEIHDRITDNF